MPYSMAIVPLYSLCNLDITQLGNLPLLLHFLSYYYSRLHNSPRQQCFFTKYFLQESPITMLHIPTLSNELSPWPRINISKVPSNAIVIDQWTPSSSRRRLTSGLRFRSIPSNAQPRGRASSDAGRVAPDSHVRGRSTSFGSTQEFKAPSGSIPVQRLDRKLSECKVQELLNVRKQKLREAERKGDKIEIFRLKNLNFFDNIEKPEVNEEERKEVGFGGHFTKRNDHKDLILRSDVLDFGFISRPKSVNQGHTATLCWHLKLEYAQGLTVPKEFYQCTIHPTPSPCASSNSSITLQSTTPSSLSSESKGSLRNPKVSSLSSSTLRDRSEPSSPVTCSSTAFASEPSSPTSKTSVVPISDEEDPFLYIAKYIRRHAKGDRQLKGAKRSEVKNSSSDAKSSFRPDCICTNHKCHTFLSGPLSKHCRFCKLPRQQPEILAAVNRIEEVKTSFLAQADANLPAEESLKADESRTFEALQEDLKLVEIYNAETEKRCKNGVWWEGWLIVEDLKKKGIIGPGRYVHERDDSTH